jgi:uncharacterized protein
MSQPDSAAGADSAEGAESELAAGTFSNWADGLMAALRGERDSDVPCGDCTACCTSSQFIHIAPDETDTLRRIPKALLVPAPRMAKGHVVLGYDARGHCPMLVDNRCTIYAHRPRTCRTYDCRIFPAARLEPDEPTKVLITRRVRRWRFSHPTQEDRVRHEAVQAAASFLLTNADALPEGSVPGNPTQLAVAAFELHKLFLAPVDAPVDAPFVTTAPTLEAAAAALDERR